MKLPYKKMEVAAVGFFGKKKGGKKKKRNSYDINLINDMILENGIDKIIIKKTMLKKTTVTDARHEN